MRLGSLKLKAQIYCGEELAMGPGKADLLDAIAREGSISAAGRALGMSYRRTWQLVDVMNRCWTAPLVKTVSGGGANSGSVVTDTGKMVLSAYRLLEAQIRGVATSEITTKLESHLLDKPKPPEIEHSKRG